MSQTNTNIDSPIGSHNASPPPAPAATSACHASGRIASLNSFPARDSEGENNCLEDDKEKTIDQLLVNKKKKRKTGDGARRPDEIDEDTPESLVGNMPIPDPPKTVLK